MKFLQIISEAKDSFISILALTGALMFIQIVILQKPLDDWRKILIGVLLSAVGLHLFVKGAELSLIPLGDSVGKNLIGVNREWVIILIAFVIGYFGTLVEPALKILADQVQEITVGAISRNVLVHVVAIGFGLGMGIGIVRILKNIPYLNIIIPLLVFIVILMFFAPDEFRSIAMDAASATTGPVNIPLNLAIAVGLASIIKGIDPLTAGFGIIGLTSIGTVISVLSLGIIVKFI